MDVLAERTTIAHLVEHDPRIRIVDYELTAEHQMISKGFIRIFAHATEATNKLLNTNKGMKTTFMTHLRISVRTD